MRVPAVLVLGWVFAMGAGAQEFEQPAGTPVESPAAEADLPSPPVAGSAALDEGIASWYGLPFHGRRTASGERFDMHALTAAHPTLPFGTRVRVHAPHSGRSVVVRINDRGPYARGRIIDLSYAAAKSLGLLGLGTRRVVITRAASALR